MTSADVADGSLIGRDMRTLSASDIERNTLGTGQVWSRVSRRSPWPARRAPVASAANYCEESSTYVDCGTAPAYLARPGRILIIAAVNTGGNALRRRRPRIVSTRGRWCSRRGVGDLLQVRRRGRRHAVRRRAEGAGQHGTLTAVTDVYPPGPPSGRGRVRLGRLGRGARRHGRRRLRQRRHLGRRPLRPVSEAGGSAEPLDEWSRWPGRRPRTWSAGRTGHRCAPVR